MERWDRLRTLELSQKKLSKVVLYWSDGSVEEYPRDFADKKGQKGNYGESGKAKVALVVIAGADGDDLISVLRGVYDKQLIKLLARQLEAW